MNLLVDLINFDIIPTDYIIEKVFRIKESADDTTNNILSHLGYKSTNLLSNMGTFFIALAFILGLVVLIIIMRFMIKKFERVRKVYEWLNKKLFFNLFLRTVMEGYLNFCISAFLAISKLSFDTADQIIDSIIGLLMLLLISVFPIFTLAFLYYNRLKLENPDFKVRWDSLYDSVVVEKNYAILLCTFFVLRRLIYAVTLCYLQNHTYL